MYSALLTAHSILRWLVIAAGVVAAVHAWRASAWRTPARASAAGLFFAVLFDVQVLLGLILYFVSSPVTTAAIHSVGPAMSNDVVRFWLVEHPFGMIVALVLTHVGRAKSRDAAEDQRRRRQAAVYFTLAILLVLITMPWPFMPYGRPLV
jgi:hypothetical protein